MAKQKSSLVVPVGLDATVDGEAFSRAASFVARLCPTSAVRPEHMAIHVEAGDKALVLTVFNGLQAARRTVPATVRQGGAVLCDGRLGHLQAQGETQVCVQEVKSANHLGVYFGRASLRFGLLPETPIWPEFPATSGEIRAADLDDAVGAVIWSCGGSAGMRWPLNSVQIWIESGRLRSYALSGPSAALFERVVGKGDISRVAVPQDFCQTIRALCAEDRDAVISIGVVGGALILQAPGCTIFTPTHDNLAPIIPGLLADSPVECATFSPGELDGLLSHTKLVQDKLSSRVDVQLRDDALEVRSMGAVHGDSEVQVDIESVQEPAQVACALEYLSAVCAALKGLGESANIRVGGPSDPLMFFTDEVRFLVAPINPGRGQVENREEPGEEKIT